MVNQAAMAARVGAAMAEHILNAFVLAYLLLSRNYPHVANRWTFPAASHSCISMPGSAGTHGG
jgi:hypothetical protein